MIEAVFAADVPGGGRESRVAGEDVAYEGGIEIVDGEEGVEGAFGEGSLAACSGG